MIIMFIFLGLTVVFIVGTVLYLNKNKRQNNNKTERSFKGQKISKKKLFKGRNKSIKVMEPVRLASSSLFIFG